MSRRSRDRNPPGEWTFFAQLARDPSALVCHLGALHRVERVVNAGRVVDSGLARPGASENTGANVSPAGSCI